MITIRRGRSSDATKSSAEYDGRKLPSCPNSSTRALVLASVRLCTATACPCRAKLRARLLPITARPVTPICALSLMDASLSGPAGAVNADTAAGGAVDSRGRAG